jgi:serine/threonine-protein kinase ATR
MASELHGRPARPGQYQQQQQQQHQHHGFANSTGGVVGGGGGGGGGGPPPSTLAAQLVENISASAAAKSSRPDETTELKRLFATIEKVKNDPACLTTHDERVEHNHLLVYVCGGVFLESLKLDDAFTDGERLREDALKAVNFLRVTIKETPTVLKCTTDGKVFLRRGAEPLWVWILPKLLRMLGHRRCVGIAGEIEELCRFVLLLAAGDAGLWGLGKELMEYFRANLSGKFT